MASADIGVSPPFRVIHLCVWVPDGPRQNQRMRLALELSAMLFAGRTSQGFWV